MDQPVRLLQACDEPRQSKLHWKVLQIMYAWDVWVCWGEF